jgi:hypothetical protein
MRGNNLWYALIGKPREQRILGFQARHGESDDAENHDQKDGERQPQSRPDLQVTQKHRVAPQSWRKARLSQRVAPLRKASLKFVVALRNVLDYHPTSGTRRSFACRRSLKEHLRYHR